MFVVVFLGTHSSLGFISEGESSREGSAGIKGDRISGFFHPNIPIYKTFTNHLLTIF